MPMSAANSIGPTIVIVDFGNTNVKPAEIPAVAKALTKQVQEHFSAPPPLGFDVQATVRVGSGPEDVRADEWLLGLFAKPDVASALGYHYQTNSGQPLMKIFPLLDAQDGVSWSSTASHEVLETLADPNLVRAAQAPDGTFWAYEVCDAVEMDTYKIDGVEVSNFVLPPYFEPPKDLTGLKLDYLGLVKQPLEIRPGGYGQYWTNSGWQQVQARTPSRQYRTMRSSSPERKLWGRAARRKNAYPGNIVSLRLPE